MNPRLSARFRTSLVAAVLLLTHNGPLSAFTSGPVLTLTEQLQHADAGVVVQWVKGEQNRFVTNEKGVKTEVVGSTTFRIQQLMKPAKEVSVNQTITKDYYVPGKAGDLFILFGFEEPPTKGIAWWGTSTPISKAGVTYLAEAPLPRIAAAQRLDYFFKFLDSSEPMIAADSFWEFDNADHNDIAQMAAQLPREKIRQWIADPETWGGRLGLYCILLGHCGTSEDATLLEKLVLIENDDFRIGIDGVMSGYLLIAGEKGLDVLDQHKLVKKGIPFSEMYGAQQAVRFMWRHGKGRISEDRLRQSMRLLLDRADMADLAIADLARWKDWSIQDKVMAKYGEGDYNIPCVKRAIVRYLLASSKAVTPGGPGPQPAYVIHGQKLLEELRKKDPKTVSETERYLQLYVAP